MKRMKGIVSTALLAGTVMCGGLSLVYADTGQLYQVVTPGEQNEKPTTVGFETQKEFESYVQKHPVTPNLSKAFQSSRIYSTFYHDIHLQGSQFPIDASRNPVIITNFNSFNNDQVSSYLPILLETRTNY
ncbi:hypothetical protein [Bacillus thuringiensis]|uniref:hypothetical protein n=1 Tax=Bacillus thuringiensis TaxID=1428 RepID=UPI003BF62C63